MSITLPALSLHAWPQWQKLGLDACEREMTPGSIRSYLINVTLARLSMGVAGFPPDAGLFSGLVCMLIAPLRTLNGASRGQRCRRLPQPAEEGG